MFLNNVRCNMTAMEYFREDQTMIAGYRILGDPIGKGGFAEVFCAEDEKTGRKVALKRIHRKHVRSRLPNYEERILKEVQIHQKLSKPGHPNVVKLYGSFKDEDYVYVVMEYCPNKDMRHYLKEHGALDETLAARVLEQVARGVKYLHSQNVIHRDLSTGNVLISQITANDMVVKIGDLGLSTQQTTPNQKHFTVCGTPNFISPEVALSKKGGAGHGKEADIWSLGAFLYTLLNGRPPFGENQEASETLKRIIAGERGDTRERQVFSPLATDLIAGMMNPNVTKRMTIDEVLCHPFLVNQERRGHMPTYSNLVSSASADSGRGSLRNSGFSGPVIHSSRSLERTKGRRISPSPPVRGAPLRAINRGNLLPPVPSGRVLPPPARRHAENIRARSASRDEGIDSVDPYGDCRSGTAIRTVSRTSPESHHSTCGHSQINDERCCRRCGRTMSILAEENSRLMPPSRGTNFGGRCSSFRETGSCRGTCRVLSEERGRELHHGERSGELSRRRNSCSRERQMVVEHPVVVSPPDGPQQSVSSMGSMSGKPLKPICSERLKPQVEKSAKAMLRILENGEVCIEFLRKTASGTEFVVEVMRISANGKKIVIYKPSSDTTVNKSAPPPYSIESAEHYETLDKLPAKHHRKYIYASRFVDLVRSKTPKITLYAETSKCILKENGDFEMNMSNGIKCASKKMSSNRIDSSKFGQPVKLTEEENQDFDSKLAHCRAIEHALEALTGNGNACFPLILGRRLPGSSMSASSTPRTPCSEIVGARKAEENKENTPLLPASARKPLSTGNRNQNSFAGREYNSKFDCTTERDSDGSYKISFHETSEVLVLSRSENLEFRSATGGVRKYSKNDSKTLPSEVQLRLGQLMQIIRESTES